MKSIASLIIAILFPFAIWAQNQDEFILPDGIRLTKSELNQRVTEKTAELTRCFELLAQKKDPNYQATTKRAMQLFNNDNTRLVSVTGPRYPKPAIKPVRQYLNNLAKLQYEKVNITWQNAQYVTNFIKQPNGTYSAVVAFEQEFTGIQSGEANYIYRDVTQKHIEVTVKVWNKTNADGVITKSYFEVFLGNIGVTQL